MTPAANPLTKCLSGICACLGLLPPVCLGADWYWRPHAGGPYGASDGSSHADAWHSSRQIDWRRIAPGDTLYICGRHDGGPRDSQLRIAASGTADQPIRISGGCPEDAGAILAAGARWEGGWSGPDANGIYRRRHAGSARQAMDDRGPLIPQAAPPGADSPCRSFAQVGRDFYYKPCGEPRRVYPAGASPLMDVTGRDYIHVDRLLLENANKLIVVTDSDGFSLTDSHLRNARHSALLVRGKTADGVVRNNEIHDAGYGVYFISQKIAPGESSDNWLVENNYIHDIYGTGDSHCIGWQSGENNRVAGNRLHDCEGSGITFYDWGSGARVANNLIENNDIRNVVDTGRGGTNQRGIEVNGNNCPRHPDDSVGNVVRNNRIRNVEHDAFYVKAAKPSADGVYSWTFVGNQVDGAEHGVVWKNAHGYGEARGTRAKSDPCEPANLIAELSLPGFRFEDNSIANVTGSFWLPKRMNPAAQARDQSGIVSRNNRYTGPGTFVWQRPGIRCAGAEYVKRWNYCITGSLARYQELSGKEQGSVHIP